jgi:hypothetical protein
MPLPRIWLNFFSPTTERIAITIGVKGPFAAILPMFKSSAPVFLSEVCQRSGHGTLTSVAIDMSPCPCLPPGVYLGRSFPSASYFAASPGCGYASATAGARAGSSEGQHARHLCAGYQGRRGPAQAVQQRHQRRRRTRAAARQPS